MKNGIGWDIMYYLSWNTNIDCALITCIHTDNVQKFGTTNFLSLYFD